MEFIRGDTFAFKFQISMGDGTKVNEEDIETLFITCRKYPDEKYPILFQKTLSDVSIENGYCHAVFDPEDTETLKYDTYYFDIEVTLKNGYRKTELYNFRITKETTIHGGGNNGN